MDFLLILAAILLGVAMLASACRKLTRAPASLGLRDRLRISARTWMAIGTAEAAAVLGLAVGLAVPPVGAAAAAGVALLMAGAVVAHLRASLGGRHLVPAAVLAVTAVLTAAGFAGS